MNNIADNGKHAEFSEFFKTQGNTMVARNGEITEFSKIAEIAQMAKIVKSGMVTFLKTLNK